MLMVKPLSCGENCQTNYQFETCSTEINKDQKKETEKKGTRKRGRSI